MASSGVSPASAEVIEADDGLPSLLEYPATYLLIAINVAVYAAMSRLGPLPGLLRSHAPVAGRFSATGRSLNDVVALSAQIFTAPFGDQLLTSFGSCIPVRVIASGEWWRLVSSTFVHVTLLHLLLNMWCLWNLGLFGERLLGKAGLIAVYLLTGVAGMLHSVILSWITGGRDLIIAGASGAVFGLAGILIVLLSNRKLSAPWEELRSLRRQVVFFALANLLLGVLPNLLVRLAPALLRRLSFDPATLPLIDNNAHLGGLICGLALGGLLFPRMTSGRSSYRARQTLVFGCAALLLTLLSYAFATFARAGTA